MDISYKTKLIKQKAFELGFSHVGISKSMFLEKEAKQLEVWLSNNFHGKMQYMENTWQITILLQSYKSYSKKKK